MYTKNAGALTSPRKEASNGNGSTNGSHALDREHFIQNLIRHCGCLLMSVPDLSTNERDLLHQIRQGRYPMVTLQNLRAITKRSQNRVHRSQLEKLLGVEECNAVVVDLYAADLNETVAQGAFDVAVKKFRQFPCRANQEAVMQAGREQIAHTETVMHSVSHHKLSA